MLISSAIQVVLYYESRINCFMHIYILVFILQNTYAEYELSATAKQPKCQSLILILIWWFEHEIIKSRWYQNYY